MAEKLKTNHLSMPRNKLLANVFYYAGFIEAWGRGTTMIVEKCVEHGLPEPEFIEDHGVMTIIFYKQIFSKEKLKEMGLNERQIIAVLFIKEKGKASLSDLKNVIPDVSEKTIQRDMELLMTMKIIIAEGEKKGKKYKLK